MRVDSPRSSSVAPVDVPRTGSPVSLRQRSRRARIVIAVLAAGVAWASLPFLGGLLGAVVLAVLLAPLHRWLAPKVGPRLAALLLAVASALLLVAPIALVLASSIQEGPRLFQRVLTSAAFARLSELRVGPLDVGAQLADAGRNVVSWTSARLVGAAAAVTRTVLNLLLAVVGVYYLLPAGSALWQRLRALIPFSSAGSDHLAQRFVTVTEALANGLTTLIGGGTGPATGTNATTCTPGPWNIHRMLEAADGFPINLGFLGKGNSSLPEGLNEQVEAGAVKRELGRVDVIARLVPMLHHCPPRASEFLCRLQP